MKIEKKSEEFVNNGLRINSELVCPVCGKTFKVTKNTQFKVKYGYTCSLACFTIYRYEYVNEQIPEYYKKEYKKILKERKLKNGSK